MSFCFLHYLKRKDLLGGRGWEMVPNQVWFSSQPTFMVPKFNSQYLTWCIETTTFCKCHIWVYWLGPPKGFINVNITTTNSSIFLKLYFTFYCIEMVLILYLFASTLIIIMGHGHLAKEVVSLIFNLTYCSQSSHIVRGHGLNHSLKKPCE